MTSNTKTGLARTGLSCAVAVGVLSLAAASGAWAAEGAPAARPAPPPAAPAPIPPNSANGLPNWSGVWARTGGGNMFDMATAEPKTAFAGEDHARESPPYNAAYEVKYKKAIAVVDAGRFTDPLTFCLPRGMPGMMAQPDQYEFAVTPEMVWIVVENGGQVRRIYTDGRDHPEGDDLFPTYTGHSVGHWEGDTLVVDTVGLRDDMIVDRTGLTLSAKAHLVERIRMVEGNLIEDKFVIDDADALTRPWTVTRLFRRQPKGSMLFDYACAENNRNPVDATGKTRAVGPDGKPID
jgi:hypothetical protein